MKGNLAILFLFTAMLVQGCGAMPLPMPFPRNSLPEWANPSQKPAPSTESLRRRAADLMEGGNAVEQFEVGVTLRTREEFELGDRLICLSAHQGLRNAQAWMAHLYRYGYPPHKPNLVQAYKWYAISYKGSLNSVQIRDYIAPQMTPAQIAEAESLVSEWEPNASECDVIAAQSEN